MRLSILGDRTRQTGLERTGKEHFRCACRAFVQQHGVCCGCESCETRTCRFGGDVINDARVSLLMLRVLHCSAVIRTRTQTIRPRHFLWRLSDEATCKGWLRPT